MRKGKVFLFVDGLGEKLIERVDREINRVRLIELD